MIPDEGVNDNGDKYQGLLSEIACYSCGFAQSDRPNLT